MTLIGRKERFAISYLVDEDSGGEWMFGKFCYFINGKEVGDFELGTSLRDVYLQMTHIIGDCESRDGGSLCRLRDKDLFETLRFLVYDDDHGNVTHLARNIEMPARFDIRIPVDVFDRWSIFLVDCQDGSRLIFKELDTQGVCSAKIERGEFDDAIRAVYAELGSIYDRVLNQKE